MTKTVQNTRYAVLTGDLVDSSKMRIADRKKLTEELNGLFEKFKVKSRNELGIKVIFEWYRGDGFQGLIEKPTDALRVTLIVRSFLQGKLIFPLQKSKADARIAIGIGKISLKANSLAESDGESFQRSGRLLDSMKKMPNRIALESSRQAINKEMQTHFILLEGLIMKWTPLQAEVIYYKLLGYTEIMIAELLKVKQPTVNQHSKNASWVAVEILLKRYETLLLNK